MSIEVREPCVNFGLQYCKTGRGLSKLFGLKLCHDFIPFVYYFEPYFWSLQKPGAAIDHVGLPGDEAARIRGEIDHCSGQVGRFQVAWDDLP